MNIDVGKQKHDFKKESKTDKGSEINKRKKKKKKNKPTTRKTTHQAVLLGKLASHLTFSLCSSSKYLGK